MIQAINRRRAAGGKALYKKSFDYTGTVQTDVLHPGTYLLQCWGARGGGTTSSKPYVKVGGLGGYSEGVITLFADTQIYCIVGQYGDDVTSTDVSSFGGGGSALKPGKAGGGATDIRIGENSLYARVIVAGGGGGGNEYSRDTFGGCGGGVRGGTSGCESNIVVAASQTYPGSGTFRYIAGKFGYGGNGSKNTGSPTRYGGGGGGGWYGGAGRSPSATTTSYLQGGGGSGYVYTSDTASYYPDGCLLNSNYYLTDAYTTGGDTTFPSVSGGTETGHEGNGYIKITQLS